MVLVFIVTTYSKERESQARPVVRSGELPKISPACRHSLLEKLIKATVQQRVTAPSLCAHGAAHIAFSGSDVKRSMAASVMLG
jgi:hypothetical protein